MYGLVCTLGGDRTDLIRTSGYTKKVGHLMAKEKRNALLQSLVDHSRNIESQDPAGISDLTDIHIQDHTVILAYTYSEVSWHLAEAGSNTHRQWS